MINKLLFILVTLFLLVLWSVMTIMLFKDYNPFCEKVYMYLFFHDQYVIYKDIKDHEISHNFIQGIPEKYYNNLLPDEFYSYVSKEDDLRVIVKVNPMCKNKAGAIFVGATFPFAFKELTKNIDTTTVW